MDVEETQSFKLEAATVAEVISLNYGEVHTVQHIQEELKDMPLLLHQSVDVFEIENVQLCWDDYDYYQLKSSIDLDYEYSFLDTKECYRQIEEYKSYQFMETYGHMEDIKVQITELPNYKKRKKPFRAMSRVEVTPVIGPWLSKSVIKLVNPHENGKDSVVLSRKILKMKNTVRKAGNRKMESHRRVNCKMKIKANTKRVKWKAPICPIWNAYVANQSHLDTGSGYCSNVAERFPYDRGKGFSYIFKRQVEVIEIFFNKWQNSMKAINIKFN